MSYKKIELTTIADGKAIAQFNFELERALENCRDIATTAGATREVKLVVKLKPSEDRQRAEITFQASSKICPDAPGTELVIFGAKGNYVSSSRQLTLDEQGDNNVEELGTPAETKGDA